MRTYAADFETTVYDGQEFTEVWASAMAEIGGTDEDVYIFHSIQDTLDFLAERHENCTLYYHNLKFDGAFWLNYLIGELNFKSVYSLTPEGKFDEWIAPWDLRNGEMIYNISSMGQWYKVCFRYKSILITLKDSLKLLPFTLKQIGKAFGTKHQKLEMEYEGYRYAGCEITEDEKQYIINDVLVLKEALEMMFASGHNSLTIGGCCLKEYKAGIGRDDWVTFFPRLDLIPLDRLTYGADTVDEYVRHSYRGGWCYLVKGAENKVYKNGTTADVNSLYPSMMSSESGNRYPVGKPTFWSGNYIPEQATKFDNRFFFVRIRTRFKIKPGKLPFIQIKGNYRYKATEMLETSDIRDKQGRYHETWTDSNGEEHDTRLTITMTQMDYWLFLDHYDTTDFEILDGCWFYAAIGIFDDYIEKYKQQKIESTGAKRTEAKLFLNNLYGKMATSLNSSLKVAYMKDDGALGYNTEVQFKKTPVYIPVGSAITSYSRCFTITAAQKNFHGVDKPGFKYADTDSIHCDLLPDKIKGIAVHPVDFCCWKLESCWDKAKFVRQKTYMEHITHEDEEPIQQPYWNVKCAGMPKQCKDLFLYSMEGNIPEKAKLKPEWIEWVKEKKRTLDDFTIGLKVPGKLVPRNIKGGVLLMETEFTMNDIKI